MKKGLLIFIFFFTSCSLSVDLSGLLISKTTADERFEISQSDSMPTNLALGSEFSFLVISDIHEHETENSNFYFLSNQIESNDAMILLAGDLSQSGELRDYVFLKNQLSHLGLPYFGVPGNHDVYFGNEENFFEAFGPSCYRFEAEHLLVIGLDSATGTLGNLQINWLENELENATNDLIVVFFHHALICPNWGQLQQMTDSREILFLMDLFAENGVDLVFTGHTHSSDSNVVRGVTYLNCDDFVDTGFDREVLRIFISNETWSAERFSLRN